MTVTLTSVIALVLRQPLIHTTCCPTVFALHCHRQVASSLLHSLFFPLVPFLLYSQFTSRWHFPLILLCFIDCFCSHTQLLSVLCVSISNHQKYKLYITISFLKPQKQKKNKNKNKKELISLPEWNLIHAVSQWLCCSIPAGANAGHHHLNEGTSDANEKHMLQKITWKDAVSYVEKSNLTMVFS